jgi:hypothetical protein
MKRLKNSVTERQFILLSGIPGSGKTYLGNYLKEKHGFCFFETDANWDVFNREMRLGDVVSRWLDKHDHVCLEWGFKPCYLPHVLSLKNQGARLFWLTCDKAIARPNYLQVHRKDDPTGEAYDKQVKRIEDAHLPTPDFIKIETSRDGKPKSPEELAQQILSKHGD